MKIRKSSKPLKRTSWVGKNRWDRWNHEMCPISRMAKGVEFLANLPQWRIAHALAHAR